MLKRLSLAAAIPLLTIVSALLLGGLAPGPDQPALAVGAAQTTTALTLDVEVNGNSAASVGFIDSCTGVDVNDSFPIDVLVQKVNDLVGWEVYLQYDRNRLEVVDVDVGTNSEDPLFLGVSSNSNVINVSDPVPNRSGLYRLAAADIAIPAAPERGSGVLARVTLKAKAAGIAALALPHLDYNKDGIYDLGPRLITLAGQEIGDNNGDGFLDTPGNSGHVAIGSSCGDVPAPTAAPDGTGGAQPTAALGETPIDGTQPPGDGSGDTPGAGGTADGDEEADAEATPEGDEDTSVANVGDQPEEPSRGGQDRPGGGGDGFFEPWMALPVIALGLLGLLFGVFALRRGGLGL